MPPIVMNNCDFCNRKGLAFLLSPKTDSLYTSVRICKRCIKDLFEGNYQA